MERPLTYKHLTRENPGLYIILIGAPILGLVLYLHDCWMILAFIIAYFVQFVAFGYIFDEKTFETIPADSLDEYVRKEKRYQKIHSILLIVSAVLDFFPLLCMSESFIGFFHDLFQTTNDIVESDEIIWYVILALLTAVIIIWLGVFSEYSNIFSIKAAYDKNGLTPLEEEEEKKKQLLQQEEETRKLEIEKYGEGSLVLDRSRGIYVNENTEKLYLYCNEYNFKDILSFTVQDNSQTIHSGGQAITTTDTGSMMRRAAVGGALFGDEGRIVGAATATQVTTFSPTVSSLHHHYVIVVTVNNISSPMVVVDLGGDQVMMSMLSSTLTVIINRNKK